MSGTRGQHSRALGHEGRCDAPRRLGLTLSRNPRGRPAWLMSDAPVARTISVGASAYALGVDIADEFGWLPDDQLHVAETLAYVDALIERAGNIHYAHLDAGALDFEDVVDGDTTTVTIKSVRPIPAALGRVFADILNQLRAAVEHVLLVEVARDMGRELTGAEESAIEMPTSMTSDALLRWAANSRRKTLTTLHVGRPTYRRVEQLMPLQRRVPDDHPMRVLARHTNSAKHRTPVVAAALVGKVVADFGDPRLTPAPRRTTPAQVGDVVATAPTGAVVLTSIWPQISVQRPNDHTWRVLMYEIRDLEAWVRRVAIPILVTGDTHVPVIRPRFDVTEPIADLRSAMAAAPAQTAMDSDDRRIRAVSARISLADTIVLSTDIGPPEQVSGWVRLLSDEDVLRYTDRLIEARHSDQMQQLWVAALREAFRARDGLDEEGG